MIIGKCPVCGADMRVGTDMTNADRIRGMSDEELASILMKQCYKPFGGDNYCRNNNCFGCWLNWLKQETQT